MKQRELKIKVEDFILLEKNRLSSRCEKKLAYFGLKFVGYFKILEVKIITEL